MMIQPKNTISYILIGILLICTLSSASAQNIKHNSNSERVVEISMNRNQRNYSLENFKFTSLILKSKQQINFQNYSLLVSDDTVRFEEDSHGPTDYYRSHLIHFNQLQSGFELIKGDNWDIVSLVLINGDYGFSFKANDTNVFNKMASCDQPTTVSQSEWRAGLTAPTYSRSYSTVYNLIVHHSAGSNNVSDYLQAVRDIYLLHTQEFGWSDIGYNYLIDPEGTIYAGRDPGAGEQDKVIGAHFCGSNTGTMGVCLLGNYELVNPTEATITSLESLLSWKIKKEDQIEALGTHSHPLDNNLPQIAGHRDGCSTACPGTNVYNKLNQIRNEVNTIIIACGNQDTSGGDGGGDSGGGIVVDTVSVIDNFTPENFVVYPNPSSVAEGINFYLSPDWNNDLEEINLVNINGELFSAKYKEGPKGFYAITLPKNMASGVYFISFTFGEEVVTRKFVIK